jgi:SAM-dependent methyltransferase
VSPTASREDGTEARFGSDDMAARYETQLEPVLFEPWAEILARWSADGAPRAVLETACGTGVLTARLRAVLSAATRVVATDASAAMLARAAARLGHRAQVELRVADFEALPPDAAQFDVLACQFGLMFARDLDAAAREAHRVLRPGGRIVAAVWAPEADNPHALATREALDEATGGATPAFCGVPFALGDGRALLRSLEASGFDVERAEYVERPLACDDAARLAQGLVHGTPLGAALTGHGAAPRHAVDAIERRLARTGGRRPYRSTMRALLVVAKRGSTGPVRPAAASPSPAARPAR